MLVTGKAAEAIEGFPPSGDFYREAITTLKEQFGNSEELIAQYFETIMNLEPVRSKQDEKQKEADTDERASLVSDSSSNNDQMKCLLKFLRYELESLEQVYKHDGLKENNIHDNKQLQSGRKGTATSLLTSQNKQTCLFCEGFHKTELCDANVLLSKKKEVLKRNARCYRCTKRNHNSRDCRNKSIFYENCKGRHVTTMCDPEWLKRSKSITSNDQSTNVNSSNEKA
ncbi:hypothetical protein ILUMI_14122, partial [Ignelater luminosus]